MILRQNHRLTLTPGANWLRHTTHTTLTATPALQPDAALCTACAALWSHYQANWQREKHGDEYR